MEYSIRKYGVFRCPVYIIKRDLNLSPTQSLRLQQEEEIESLQLQLKGIEQQKQIEELRAQLEGEEEDET